MISPAFLPVPIGTGLYPMRGDYGRKDLESANRKAPRDSDFPFGAFLSGAGKKVISFVRKF